MQRSSRVQPSTHTIGVSTVSSSTTVSCLIGGWTSVVLRRHAPIVNPLAKASARTSLGVMAPSAWELDGAPRCGMAGSVDFLHARGNRPYSAFGLRAGSLRVHGL